MTEIVLSQVRFAYPALVAGQASRDVLQGINLSIERGEFFSLMGRTGAGKTTLSMVLNGLVPHATGGELRGEVRVAGRSPQAESVAAMAATVGIVFQDPESQLFNMTVEDEVAFGLESLGLPRSEMTRRVEWALSTVGMLDHRRRSPTQLSGGQQKRVAIAAVLAMRPRVLVLDEPAAGLDPAGKDDVFSVVLDLTERQAVTILMIEQDVGRVAEFSDRVAILDDGVIVRHGTPREVFADVEGVRAAGLAVPQVSELAAGHNARWGTSFAFVTVDEAEADLRDELERLP